VRELPRGTVTFLFTDIEGSTRLLHELGPEEYGSALSEHRRVLRVAFERHDGVEVDTQGDAFFVAFPTAPGGLAAAREAQDELELPVRMGLHTGTPLLTEEGYVGADVHRAARIAGAGHGRQVLVSAATAALLDGAELRDLGEHRLKDLSAPERIFQLGERDFPPLKTLHRTNLPVPATQFLGRDEELTKLRELLAREDVRLLTLTGAGGSGKTRLALQAAGEAAEAYPDGVWWVPLAPLTDSAEVLPAAARTLGGGGSLAEIVGDRRLLLLLDNFEHVVGAAADVAVLLGECPHSGVLVTSRERLRVQGEHVYPVPVLARAEARELFLTRARAAQPDFEADGHLDELCERLDDLPLALELAAARVSLLTTEQLLERLGDRLDLLRGGRDAETRQQTLRATIEWSYDLLEPDERRLLASLSVFRGGWTLEGAEQVADAELELLQSLTDKSLIRRWESGRFGMLETIREFGADQLEPAEEERLLRRLVDYLLQVFEAANLRPDSIGAPRMELVQAERANIDVALVWATGAGEVRAGLRLLELTEMYWGTNDPVGGRERLNALLARGEDELEPQLLAKALRFRGGSYDMVGQFDLGTPEYERAIELLREVGDDAEISHLKLRIANSAVRGGELDLATRLAEEALARRGSGERDKPMALSVLAFVAFARGDAEEGVRLARETAEAAAEVDFLWWGGVTLLGSAECQLGLGELEGAQQDLADSIQTLAEVRDLVNLPFALGTGAAIAARLGDPARAGTLWGAFEAQAERDPRPTTPIVVAEMGPHLEEVHGSEFDEARARGRRLSLDEAIAYALEGRT
jgi:predicted ATPase/class 3 adenylate cyclase